MESKELPKIFMDDSDTSEKAFIHTVDREAIKHRLSYIQLHRALMKIDDWYFKRRLSVIPVKDYDEIIFPREDGKHGK